MSKIRIGKVYVDSKTPPSKEQLKEQLILAGYSKETIKTLIDGSKLYDRVAEKPKPSANPIEPRKDS